MSHNHKFSPKAPKQVPKYSVRIFVQKKEILFNKDDNFSFNNDKISDQLYRKFFYIINKNSDIQNKKIQIYFSMNRNFSSYVIKFLIHYMRIIV